MWRSCRQVLAILLAVLSSYFLIRGVMNLNAKDMVSIASTKWDLNLDLLKNLCYQRADTVVGFILLPISVILQAVNMFQPVIDFGVNRKGFILAIIFSIVIYFMGHCLSGYLYSDLYRHAEMILREFRGHIT